MWWARALVVALWLGACTPAPSWDPSDRLEATYGAQRYTPAATGVPYVDGATAPVLDVYLPVAGGNRGVIVFVHGGGFTSGSRGDLFTWSGPLSHALEHGWALVNIEYRLEAWPAAVEDLDAALRWVDGDGVSVWGLNPEHVVVAGHSAGATIAAVHALHDGGEVAVDTELGELRRVDGWVSLAGILDLDHPSGTGARRAWQAPSARAASPAAVVDDGDPVGLVVHGAHDTVVPRANVDAFTAAAGRAGAGVEMDLVEAGPHECSGHTPACGMSVRGYVAWLDRVAGQGGAGSAAP